MKSLLAHLSSVLHSDIRSVRRVSGGDINDAYCLQTQSTSFFVKVNAYENGRHILQCEYEALEAIRARRCIAVPRTLTCGTLGKQHYLVLEWIESGSTTDQSFARFGEQLAQMHRSSNATFGWSTDNFIGRLPQINGEGDDWPTFYIQKRIEPQLRQAIDDGRMKPSLALEAKTLHAWMQDHCPHEMPALIHGDLWAGNYLISRQGDAYLIDPAICFAHREMDLAMSRLFGGFPPIFYEAYANAYPLTDGFDERVALYQLYYILAHVNLFGGSYVRRAEAMIGMYT